MRKMPMHVKRKYEVKCDECGDQFFKALRPKEGVPNYCSVECNQASSYRRNKNRKEGRI